MLFDPYVMNEELGKRVRRLSWHNFYENHNGRLNKEKFLKERYNAELKISSKGSYIIVFPDDAEMIRFVLEWS